MTAINLLFQGTNEGLQFCVRLSESHNVERVLGHMWREDQRESNMPRTVVLLLSDDQPVACVPHPMVLPGSDPGCPHTGFAVRYIRTQEVNYYVPLILRFLSCLSVTLMYIVP
jgi:hypothetical protein